MTLFDYLKDLSNYGAVILANCDEDIIFVCSDPNNAECANKMLDLYHDAIVEEWKPISGKALYFKLGVTK